MSLVKIIEKIKLNNGEIYLVGGAIRDQIMNIQNHDLDFCICKLDKNKFLEIFPEAKEIGNNFSVFLLEGMEFALARKERKIEKGHKGFEIETENITIIEDLERRDITINSIAKNMITGEIVDPFNGVEDIKNKIIRATSQRFKEDPLRVYRVARFAAKFDFDIEENTLVLMKNLRSELNTLPKERIFEEFRKALNTDNPQVFFDVLREAEVLDVHFKEIYNLIGAEQPKQYHPEGDAYNHTMLVLKNISRMTKKEEIRYSGLVHDLGKGITPKEEYPHHYNHDINGAELVTKLGERIGVKKSWTKCGITSAREHMKAGIFGKMTIKKKVSFIEKISKTQLGLEGLQLVTNADKMSMNTEKTDSFLEIGKEILSKINGKYIMEKYQIEDGKKIKEKLHEERIEYMKKLIYNDKKLGGYSDEK